jgi:hypothetical protein
MSTTLFPNRPGHLADTLSDEGITIDGMKVLFDQKVALYPVTLKPGADVPESRRPAEGDRDADR